MKLVAIKTFSYAGKRLAIGEVFEVKTDRDAKLLVGIKNARLVDDRKEEKLPAPKKETIEAIRNKVNEPKKEEPAKEEPAKEEPAKEEPAKEEPAKETPRTNTTNNRRNYNRKN
jgi:hypothetical protein